MLSCEKGEKNFHTVLGAFINSSDIRGKKKMFYVNFIKKRHDSINPYWSHVLCKFWKFSILAKFHSKLKCRYIPSLFNITCKVNIPTKWKHAVRNRHLQSHPPDATCHFLLKSKYHLIEVGLFLILLVDPFEALEIQQVTQSLGASDPRQSLHFWPIHMRQCWWHCMHYLKSIQLPVS